MLNKSCYCSVSLSVLIQLSPFFPFLLMGFWLSDDHLWFQKQGSREQLFNWGICSLGEWSNFWQNRSLPTLQTNLLFFFSKELLFLWMWQYICDFDIVFLCCSGLLNNECIFFDLCFLTIEIISPFGLTSVNYSSGLFVSFSSAS